MLQNFDDCFIPKNNSTFEKQFFTCVKKSHETIDICANELCTKAKSCDIGDLTESLLRDRIICGIADDVLHARLLRIQDLNLQKAITICHMAESTNKPLKEFNRAVLRKRTFVNKSTLRKREMMEKISGNRQEQYREDKTTKK